MRLATAAALVAAAVLAVPAARGADGAAGPKGEGDVAGRCVEAARWAVPGERTAAAVAASTVLDRAAGAQVVLLGETHESAEHHRWQLQVLAALQARRSLAIALEMFPRRAQAALDRWVAGETDEATFLAESDWRQVWGFDPALYLPILHFARMNRVPLVAVNVERAFVAAVAERGFAAVPVEQREGVDEPAPATGDYRELLFDSWREHLPEDETAAPSRDAAEFLRFVEAQLTWDRAMALGIRDALARHPGALVVGIMGSGHVAGGHGVPRQLESMGFERPVSLLPWDVGADCSRLTPGYAAAIFGIDPPPLPASQRRVRLGVTLAAAPGGARISGVERGSVAERARLRVGDLIVAVGGARVETPSEVAAAVARQPAGSWLPIRVERGRRSLERVARFPPEPGPDGAAR